MERCILHCDMNAYYASVEMALNPSLRGKAIAVGGSREDRNGIILAKSQKAKEKGVKTGEIIAEALGKCPELVIVPPQYEAYIHYSEKARAIYYRYTDQVESFGLDECWLDVSNSQNLFGNGVQIANTLRAVMKKELKLSISVGVSFNKVFAKLGSDLKKPDATTLIAPDDIEAKIWILPVGTLLGVGPATKRKLNNMGIQTIGQLAKCPSHLLQDKLGINGHKLWRWANGYDDGRVRRFGESRIIKSIGHGLTLREDLYSKDKLWPVMLDLSQELARRLRAERVKTAGVQIYLKTSSFRYRELQTPLPYPTRSGMYLARAAYRLALQNMTFQEPLRAVGIRAYLLLPEDQPLQLNFFSDAEELDRLENLEDTMYELRGRYGSKIITWGCLGKKTGVAEATPWQICPPGLPD